MNTNKIKQIFVDTAEPKYIDMLLEEKGFTVIRSRILPSGDFAFGKKYISEKSDSKNNVHIKEGVIIERKDVGDFDSSFSNNDVRFWKQLQAMQEISSDQIRCFYAIIGDISKFNNYASISPKQRIAAMTSAMARYPNVQMTTFLSKNDGYHEQQMFIDYIDKLYRSYFEDKFNVGRTIGFKPSVYKSFDEYVLSGVPGISLDRASDILQHFDIKYDLIPKDPANVSNLMGVKGIGSKTSLNIRKELKIDG